MFAETKMIDWGKNPTVDQLKTLKSDDLVFTDQVNLKPVLENDPLLSM